MLMRSIPTSFRFLFPIVALLLLAVLYIQYDETSRQQQQLINAANDQTRELSQILMTTEAAVGDEVKASMALLKYRGNQLGSIHQAKKIEFGDLMAPNLVFGTTPQANRFELVDGVTAIMGGTATIFAKSGDNFVRISTNVQSDKSLRGVGTLLDPNGKAIKALRQGKPFYGVVDILGAPYITGYEPMRDDHGAFIGAWNVGYKADLDSIKSIVNKSRFLNTGFQAVLDSKNTIRFHSNHLPDSMIREIIKTKPSDWQFVSSRIPEWGYTVLTAYPKDEAIAFGFKEVTKKVIVGFLFLALLFAVIFRQMKKLVYRPLGGDPAIVTATVHRISTGDLSENEKKAPSGSLMEDLSIMRVNLRAMLQTITKNAEELRLVASVVTHSHNSVVITSSQGNILEVNPAFTTLTGYTRAEVLGKKTEILKSDQHDALFYKGMWQSMTTVGKWSGELWNRRKSGEIFAEFLNVTAIYGQDGNVSHYVGISTDITDRKLAEIKLMESEHKLSLILENVDAYIYLKDTQGRYLFANRTVCKLFGKSPEEVVGQTDDKFFDAETVKQLRVNDRSVLDQGETLKQEETNRNSKDGLVSTYLSIKLPLRNESGEIYALCGISTDITELKKSEMLLRESEAQKQLLLDSAAECIFGVDINGNCTFVNASFLRTLGYQDADELVGKHIHEMIHHSRADGTHYPAKECRMYLAYRRNERIHSNDEVYWRRDGSSFPVEFWSYPILRDGLVTGAVVTFFDITERKRVEADLRIAATAFETQVGIVVTDTNNVILRVNRTFTHITGYSQEEAVGQTPALLKSGRQDAQFYHDMWSSLNNDKLWQGEIWNRRKNGEVYPEWLTVTALTNEEGKLTNYIASFFDITTRKGVENALRQSEFHLRTLVQTIPDLIWLKDSEGVYLSCNTMFERFFGAREEDIVGKTDYDFVDKDLADFFREHDRKAIMANKPTINEEWLNFADGSYQGLFETIKSPMLDGDGKFIGVLGIAHDITQHKQAEQALKEKTDYVNTIFNSEPECVQVVAQDGELLEMNRAGLNLLEVDSLEEARSYGWANFILPEYKRSFMELHTNVFNGKEGKLEFMIKGKHGGRYWLEIHAAPLFDENGKVKALVGVTRNTTERKQAEQELRIAATAFETQEGIFVTDADNVILRANQSFRRLTGYSAEEIVGKKPDILKSGRHDAQFYRDMWEALNQSHYWQGEVWNRYKNGEVHPGWLTITSVTNAEGRATNYIGTYHDITLSKEADDKIHSLAFYDPLTGLPNRRLLLDRLQHSLAASARHRYHSAILFIDLDNFKTLNDTKGHGVGDLLLIEVASRLQNCVREIDTVARLGGDEFVVMLEELSEDIQQAAAQTETVGEKVLAALSQPYLLQGYEHHSSASAGISLFHSDEITVEELLKRTDTAMYQAKNAGRNTLRFYDPAMQAVLEARTILENDLRSALAKNQFRLFYQMQVDHAGHILGAEVLLRWQHPERGLVSPMEFIPLAEETGLILPIGQWLLETACEQLHTWETDPLTRDLQLAVNISARQFRQTDFVDQVEKVLHRHVLSPDRLKIELTESLVLDDITDAIAKMLALRQVGVRFSMDDFGTGYSSLSYLTQLPLHQLKIDQSFVRNIGTKATDAVIVQTIIGMANNLGMEVIAEGVETEEQRAFLEQHGCMLFQGYLFGKPVPVAEFEARLKNS